MTKIKFPCDKCGICCKHVNEYKPAAYLNRGDGVCKYLDENTHLCSIYESRPLFCDTEAYYEKEFQDKMSWEEYIEYLKQGCKELQNLNKK